MKKVISVVLFVALFLGVLASCGSSKHTGKCEAYSLNNKVSASQDFASK